MKKVKVHELKKRTKERTTKFRDKRIHLTFELKMGEGKLTFSRKKYFLDLVKTLENHFLHSNLIET